MLIHAKTVLSRDSATHRLHSILSTSRLWILTTSGSLHYLTGCIHLLPCPARNIPCHSLSVKTRIHMSLDGIIRAHSVFFTRLTQFYPCITGVLSDIMRIYVAQPFIPYRRGTLWLLIRVQNDYKRVMTSHCTLTVRFIRVLSLWDPAHVSCFPTPLNPLTGGSTLETMSLDVVTSRPFGAVDASAARGEGLAYY